MSKAYKNAGVDVEAGYKAVELMKEHVKRTNIPGVLSGLGGFGGLFEIGGGYEEPVLFPGPTGSAQSLNWRLSWINTTRSVRTAWLCALTTSYAAELSRCSSWIISRSEKTSPNAWPI